MQYNIHPIFVHFPVALLFVYSLLKIAPLQKWSPSINWKDVRRIFLLVGVAGAFLALGTGESAEHLVRPNRALVESHAFFASLSTWLYGALLAGEVAAVVRGWGKFSTLPLIIQKLVTLVDRLLSNGALSMILALAGLIAITITGMLGGIITYGTNADPFAKVLLNILGITL